MHAEIANRMDEIARLCRRYRVARLDLFGSAARGTDFDPEASDADFLVEFEPPRVPGVFDRYMGLRFDLAEVLGREVDLVEMKAVGNRLLQEHIDSSRETVYVRRA